MSPPRPSPRARRSPVCETENGEECRSGGALRAGNRAGQCGPPRGLVGRLAHDTDAWRDELGYWGYVALAPLLVANPP